MNEQWKIVEKFPGYEVSNYGNVKSKLRFVKKRDGRIQEIKEKILKPSISNCGYLRVALYNDSVKKVFSIHRLVAIAFISNPKNLNQVNHIDGNKKNNSSSNLEWVSCSENISHAFKLGLKCQKGENHQQSRLTKNDVLRIRELIQQGFKQREIAEIFKIKRSYVSDIKTKKAWSHI